MIAYLDSSALVKRYVAERWTDETLALTSTADVVATSLVSRAEVAAAFAKAVRSGMLSEPEARKAQRTFSSEWHDFARVPVTEALVARAETLAWDHGLRGYDAVQLASALAWQESVGVEIVLASFDRQLWEAARLVGIKAWPEDPPEAAQAGAAQDPIGPVEDTGHRAQRRRGSHSARRRAR